MKITTAQSGIFLFEGKQTSVVAIPSCDEKNFPVPRQKHFQLISTIHLPIDQSRLSPEVVGIPGEYEVLGVAVHGVQISRIKKDALVSIKTAFVFIVDDVTCCILPDGLEMVDPDELDQVPEVQILLVSVDTFDKSIFEQFSKVLEPKILIPFSPSNDKTKIEAFCKTRGISTPEYLQEYTVVGSDLQGSEDKVVLIES
jgi:hypothetical protein